MRVAGVSLLLFSCYSNARRRRESGTAGCDVHHRRGAGRTDVDELLPELLTRHMGRCHGQSGGQLCRTSARAG